MSQFTSDKSVVNKRINTATDNKELAGDYLAQQGYERKAKPREVNGGKDRLPQNYAQNNKARLNSSLAANPMQKQQTAKKHTQTQVKIAEVRKEKSATPFPVSAILCLIAITLMSLYVIHLYIELDEIDATITQYNNQIAEMKNEERVLQTQKAAKYDLEEIERIAKEKYGMVDADQLPKEYITPDGKDSIEIMETSLDQETPDVLLSGFAGAVSDLLSYIN